MPLEAGGHKGWGINPAPLARGREKSGWRGATVTCGFKKLRSPTAARLGARVSARVFALPLFYRHISPRKVAALMSWSEIVY